VALSSSEIISALALAFAAFQFMKNGTVSKENATLATRVSILEARPQEAVNHEQRIAILESVHAGHGEQISGLKSDVGKLGEQLNGLSRQMVAVEEKLSNNTTLFSDRFDQILQALRQVQK
jgi:hypothetical protein